MGDPCTKEDRLKSLEKRMEKVENRVDNAEDDITTIKMSNATYDERFKNIMEVLNKIADQIEKFKYWVITGILGPILLVVIFGALNIKR